MLRLINLSPLKNSLGSSLEGPSADRDLVTVMCNVPGVLGWGGWRWGLCPCLVPISCLFSDMNGFEDMAGRIANTLFFFHTTQGPIDD